MTTQPITERPDLPRRGRRSTRDPRTVKRLATFGSLILIAMGILIVRLWFLQVVGGSELQARAAGNSFRNINIPAPRGDILDRNGVKLATSVPAWDVVALPQDLFDDTGTKLTDDGKRTLRRIARVLGENSNVLQRRMINGNKRAPYKSVVLAANIDDSIRFPLSEKIAQYPGIRIEQTYRRTYPQSGYLAHVLGYVGPITEAGLDQARRQGYRNDAIIGQDGLEARYEPFLKGTDGERRVEVDAAGLPIGSGPVSERPPETGLTLQTSIDINVQKALDDAVRQQVLLHSSRGGGGVVLDAKTGEVVAMASYPPSTIPVPGRADQIRAVSRRDRTFFARKLYNRALNPVAPASTFKPILALTALNAGLLSPDEFLTSPKQIVYDGTPFRNFRNQKLDDMQVRRALAMSSDTFFHQVTRRIWKAASKDDKRLGHNKLYDWAQAFGFGQKTGIDLPGDEPGVLPDRQWKRDAGIAKFESNGNSWRSGDTINMGVGQGYLSASPLQMARAYAALVRPEHRLMQPLIGKEVIDPKTGEVVAALQEARDQTTLTKINDEVLPPILGGMRDVTSTTDGTAWSAFNGVGGQVSGKTGTAENAGRGDHAWFVGFGPTDDPQYVVAVMIEFAGLGGQVAAPAACLTMAAALNYDPKRCGSGRPIRESSD